MTSGCADVPQLADLESDASDRGLLLRIRLNRPLGLWALRLVVASRQSDGPPRLLGELKGWAYPAISGLQLDTMRVLPSAPSGVGDLIWAATMAWALESTPCRRARLLAIRDDDRQHRRLVRYFRQRGFTPVREVAAAPADLPLRLVWGGAGVLMCADCCSVLTLSEQRWRQSAA